MDDWRALQKYESLVASIPEFESRVVAEDLEAFAASFGTIDPPASEPDAEEGAEDDAEAEGDAPTADDNGVDDGAGDPAADRTLDAYR